jgi:DNA-directed RNA polymerase specialized sigma24 family protein
MRQSVAEVCGGSNSMTLASTRSDELLALDEALDRLEQLNERRCRIVEYRFFAGMSIGETGRALNVSPATVKREWAMARAWLSRELSEREGNIREVG